MKTKQVIIMRKDLGMTAGKMVAQGAHASMGALLSVARRIHDRSTMVATKHLQILLSDSALEHWLENSFTKIGVRVESEEELLNVYNLAKEAGLICCLITDNGDTMFKGVPTITCCAIGPAFEEDIDKITKELKLL